jgi:hypothetical protein
MALLPQAVEFLPELFELLVGKFFEVDELVASPLQRSDELVELQVNGDSVPVLGVLDQEHHQERYDGRARVDDELPGIGEMKERARERPYDDDQDGRDESPGRSHAVRCHAGESPEKIVRARHHWASIAIRKTLRAGIKPPRRHGRQEANSNNLGALRAVAVDSSVVPLF